MKSARLAPLLLLAACGDDPAETPPPAEPTWSLELDELEEALLAVHPLGGDANDLLAVGGPLSSAADGTPAIYRRQAGAWAPIAPPAQWAGAAWWAWSASVDDVWVVGENGQVARGPVDGLALVDAGVPASTVFYGVWGSAADDVYLVGGSARDPSGPFGVLVHWDGSSFAQLQPTGTASVALDNALFKVWGTGPDHVVVVGTFGMALEWDGTTWTRTETNTQAQLTTVHGRSRDDYYAVGGFNQGLVLHWDGSSWTEIGERFAPRLSGVHVAPDGRVWVAGDSGYLAIWDGAEWTALDTVLLTQFHAVWAGATEVFGVGGLLDLDEASRRGFAGRYGP